MILNGAYVAAYPLHDGPADVLERDEIPKNDRQCLKREWARPGRSCKYQPYDAINKYFGSEIAMYFAWVALFTGMLAALAIIGLIVFLYGIGSAGDHSPKRSVAIGISHLPHACTLMFPTFLKNTGQLAWP